MRTYVDPPPFPSEIILYARLKVTSAPRIRRNRRRKNGRGTRATHDPARRGGGRATTIEWYAGKESAHRLSKKLSEKLWSEKLCSEKLWSEKLWSELHYFFLANIAHRRHQTICRSLRCSWTMPQSAQNLTQTQMRTLVLKTDMKRTGGLCTRDERRGNSDRWENVSALREEIFRSMTREGRAAWLGRYPSFAKKKYGTSFAHILSCAKFGHDSNKKFTGAQNSRGTIISHVHYLCHSNASL